MAGNVGSSFQGEPFDLQAMHPSKSPKDTFAFLAEACQELDVDEWDVYGDFDCAARNSKKNNDAYEPDVKAGEGRTSWLRTFEQEVANDFEKEDALFMPSGVMAQSIALLIHSKRQLDETSAKEKNDKSQKVDNRARPSFICHHTSHLILHEQDGYRHLLEMEPIIIPPVLSGTSTIDTIASDEVFVSTEQNIFKGQSPMRLKDVEDILIQSFDLAGDASRAAGSGEAALSSSSEIFNKKNLEKSISTLIIELPHREIGGKITPWDEVKEIGRLCHKYGLKYHCDGARIFEAAAAYSDKKLSLADLAAPFDSMYISFYKGLGAISGAMLLGEKDFIEEARVWLRRFGGNLYTLLPYALSSWKGYRDKFVYPGSHNKYLTFQQKHLKLHHLVEEISLDKDCRQIVVFDPPKPVTCMVHGYLKYDIEVCQAALDAVTRDENIRVLKRIRPVPEDHPSFPKFKCMFEWNMGDGNGSIHDNHFLTGWRAFAKQLLNSNV